MAISTQKLSDLPLGSKIRFGRLKGNGESPITWRIVSKNHSLKDSGYPDDAVTIVSDSIIKFMAFDAKEKYNALESRKEYGNNRYRLSNIKQWLNSESGENEWFIPQNIAGEFHYNDRDASPSQDNIDYEAGHYPYDDLQGFISMFKEYEKEVLLETKVKTATHPEYDYQPTKDNDVYGHYDETIDRFFLLSGDEVGLGNNKYNATHFIDEGAAFDYYDGQLPNSKATAYAYENSPFSTSNGYLSGYRKDNFYTYALRSPHLTNGGLVLTVDEDGKLSDIQCSSHVGIKVGTNLKSDTLVSIVMDDEAYSVLTDIKPEVELINTHFLDLDFRLLDVHNRIDKVTFLLNGVEFYAISSELDESLSITLPYSELITGNNDIKVNCFEGELLKNTQTFRVFMEQEQLIKANDILASTYSLYKVENVTDNSNGTSTVKVNKNLVSSIYKGDSIEKVVNNYQPSVYVTDQVNSIPVYEDLTLIGTKYTHDKNFAIEQWEADIDGTYCLTKINMERNSIHEDASINSLKQIFHYKNEL